MPVTPEEMLSPEPGSALRVMADLVAESYPADKPIYTTANGDRYTGEEMRAHILAGSEIGKHYASSILRVTRDLLTRQAVRYAAKEADGEVPPPKVG